MFLRYILFLSLMAIPAFADQRTTGFLVNLVYPTDSLGDAPDKRLGWFILQHFPFTLISHQQHGRFQDFIRPLRYEGNGHFYVPQGGSHSVVIDAQAPPVLYFGEEIPQRRSRLRSFLDPQPIDYRSRIRSRYDPNYGKPYNMADQAYYQCQFYVDIDGKRVTSMQIANEFDQRFAYNPISSRIENRLGNEYAQRYTMHDYNRQRCGFREQKRWEHPPRTWSAPDSLRSTVSECRRLHAGGLVAEHSVHPGHGVSSWH